VRQQQFNIQCKKGASIIRVAWKATSALLVAFLIMIACGPFFLGYQAPSVHLCSAGVQKQGDIVLLLKDPVTWFWAVMMIVDAVC
jgi:hypothetical protein